MATEQPFAIYGGECESYGLNSSYLVWQPIWRGIFGIEATWSLAKQIDALAKRLQEINPALVQRLPLLGALLNIAIPDNELTRSLDAKLRKTSLEALLVDCLRAEARKAPLLLVLEACQWLDPLSADLVVTIGNAIAELPVFLVLAMRPVEHAHVRSERLQKLAHYAEIQLQPLSGEAAAQFVALKLAQLLGAATEVAPTLVERITTQAEGNPFYIEELLNYLHYQHVDFRDQAALTQIELPDSLQRLVLSLIDQLSESQKITVKVASIIGRVFRAAWLQGMYPDLGDPGRVQADLEALRAQDMMLLDPSEPEQIYLFRQMITQGVTYESLPHAVKTALHEQIGLYIEQNYPDAVNQYLDLLAYHFDRSENLDKRRYYLRKAGEAAQAAYANLTAIDYYQRVLPFLGPAEQTPVLLRLGAVLELVGRWDNADHAYQLALTLAEEQHLPALEGQAQIAIGELRRKQSQFAEATTWYARARANAEAQGDQAGVAKALICAGTLAAQQGDYATAQTCYDQSLTIRRTMADQPNVANVLNNLGIVARFRGDYAQASAYHQEALAIRRQLDNRWAIAMSLNNLGNVTLDQGEVTAARTYLEEALTIQRTIGDKWAVANALNNLGNVVREQGDFAAAQALYLESITLNRELNEQRALAYLLEDMGILAAMQDDGDRALRLTGAATAVRETIQAPLSPVEQEKLNGKLAAARETLGSVAANDAWAAGHGWTLTQALAYAMSGVTQ